MKKICFFSGDITREGGTERVATMIANALNQENRYEILFLSLVEQKEQPFFSLDPAIKRYSLGDRWISPGPGYLRILPKLRRFLKEQEIDIIIDIDIVLDALSVPAAAGRKTKLISWEHSNYFAEQKTLYRRLILRYSVRHTDYVVTLTEEDKSNYEKYLKRKTNIRAIYNPMETYEENSAADVSTSKEKWLITVGRLIRSKGTDYLAEVAAGVLAKHQDWKWMILGDGEEKETLMDAVAGHQLEQQVVFTGTVSDVGSYLRKAQIFVMTSKSEGLPMVLLEAKSCYLPCVAFDIQTGPGEIIADGVNGYLIPPFDCREMAERINDLIEDDRLRTEFAKNSQLNTQRFQMETIVNSWNEVLEYLCDYRKH